MAICPQCKNNVLNYEKTWEYDGFLVQAYTCGKCGTSFREYLKEGKQRFTLKQLKGVNWVRV